jgi:phospholipid/cholesterol/gamma-HCH transport system substrate-binding protein
MDAKTQNFKVKLVIFIFIGLIIFVIAIFFIGKQKNLFSPVFKVTTSFYNISGLQVGNNVRFSGINVGIVDNIMIINDSTVQVDVLIMKNVQEVIKADSQASIGSSGIIGDRILTITQGSFESPIIRDGQNIESKEPVETDAIMASLSATAGNVEIITLELAEIMVNINSGQGALGRLISDSTIAENISQTIGNFKKSSAGLDETIETTKTNVYAFMESLQQTASKTEIASHQLGEIMVRINSGEGTIGTLIQDTTMAGNLNQTMLNLKRSSQGLDENMEALKHNFLFRGYFRRKAKEDEKARLDSLSREATRITTPFIDPTNQ